MASYGNTEDRNILREHLKNLLDLSLKLPLEGEITPIMAWVIIATHERVNELTLADFEMLGDDLNRVTRCYGWVPDFRFLETSPDPSRGCSFTHPSGSYVCADLGQHSRTLKSAMR